jgi:hypothetical protein
MLGFKSLDAAQSTRVGIELMHMLRKGQLEYGVAQDRTPAEPFYALAAYSPHRQDGLASHRLHTKTCAKARPIHSYLSCFP